MTKDKQIEEMAKAVCVNCTSEVCASGRCAYQYDCPLSMETIKRLHLKGYRKASEVAREIIDHIEAVLNKMFEEYAVLGQADCCVITEIIRRKLSAELKKKYTEEGK